MTASWNHRVCERCYLYGVAGAVEPAYDQAEGRVRKPALMNQSEVEPAMCCGCGGVTVIGLFVRADPTKMLCSANHN